MVAQQLMSRDPHTITPTCPAWSALAIMRDRSLSHLVIVEEGKLRGIVSNRDFRRLLERADDHGRIRDIYTMSVADIMTPASRMITALPDTPVIEIAQFMVAHGIGSMPVIDSEGTLVGIVTQKDVMRVLVEAARAQARVRH